MLYISRLHIARLIRYLKVVKVHHNGPLVDLRSELDVWELPNYLKLEKRRGVIIVETPASLQKPSPNIQASRHFDINVHGTQLPINSSTSPTPLCFSSTSRISTQNFSISFSSSASSPDLQSSQPPQLTQGHSPTHGYKTSQCQNRP
jgi:hypothetical protein